MKKILFSLFCAAALLILTLQPAHGDSAVVGTGTTASCTEAAFDSALAALYPGATAPGGVLSFNCGPNPYTIVFTGEKYLQDGTVIDGGGLITLSGGNTTRIFFVTQQARVELHHIKLAHGYSAGGGAIYAEPNNSGDFTYLLLNDVTLTLNNSYGFGGAIRAQHSALTLINSHLVQNGSASGGGAISLNEGVISMSGTEIVNNSTPNPGATGGGLDLWNTTIDIQTSVLRGNQATQSAGGAIALHACTGSIATSEVGQNTAFNLGGGLYMSSNSDLGLNQVTISTNTADSGAGIAIDNSTLLLTGSTLMNNTASNGGAIFNFNGQANVQTSVLKNNQGTYGAGISNNSVLTLSDSTLENNTGSIGGGLLNVGQAVLNRVTLSQNTAGDGGAAFNNSGGTLTLTNSTVSGNQANSGGGLFNNGTLSIMNATIAGNQASGAGGGVWHSSGTAAHLSMVNTLFSLNTGTASNNDQCFLNEPPEVQLFSLWSGTSCGTSTTNGNLSNTDVLLAPLSFTGTGLATELTRTHSLLPGSPAEDTGTCANGAPTIDQRGVARPFGAVCDIGAVEMDHIVHIIYLPSIVR
jgi:hypothetical protein